MSAKKTIVPDWVPDYLPEDVLMYIRKKGKLGSRPLLPNQRTLGRIAWVALKNEQEHTSKVQKFAFYWNIYEKRWRLVRSGPRPVLSARMDVARSFDPDPCELDPEHPHSPATTRLFTAGTPGS